MFTASDLISSSRVPLINPEDAVEIVRQRLLSELITPLVGALPPEEVTLLELQSVLDLGCGQGLFVLDLAYEHPEFEVAGIDSSVSLVADANAQACDQQLANASFGVVDLWHPPFDLSEATFDLTPLTRMPMPRCAR